MKLQVSEEQKDSLGWSIEVPASGYIYVSCLDLSRSSSALLFLSCGIIQNGPHQG